MLSEDTVPGDAFLARLYENVTERGPQLSDGTLTLALNCACAAFLETQLAAFERGGSFRSARPHAELGALYSFLLRLPNLQLHPSRAAGATGALSVELAHFGGLSSLQLLDLDPGVVRLAPSLRARLGSLSVRGSLTTCAPWFGADGPAWPALRWLDLSHNFLRELEPRALNNGATLVWLTVLDLSHNLLSAVPNLTECVMLQRVLLSHNRISDVTNVASCLGSVVTLSLQGNRLDSSVGVHHLKALQMLDLRDNNITDWEDVGILRRLPFLDQVWLKGNPIDQHPRYRVKVFAAVVAGNVAREAPSLRLDGNAMTPMELVQLRADETQRPLSTGSDSVSPDAAARSPPMPSPSAVPAPTRPAPTASGPPHVTAAPQHASKKLQKKKKKPKKAAVVLEPPALGGARVPTSPAAVVEASASASDPALRSMLQAEDADDARFAQTVRKLHQDGGSKWLVILDGMEAAAAPAVHAPASAEVAEATKRPTKGSRQHGRKKSDVPRKTALQLALEAAAALPLPPPPPPTTEVAMELERVDVAVVAAPPKPKAPTAPMPSASSTASPRDSMASALVQIVGGDSPSKAGPQQPQQPQHQSDYVRGSMHVMHEYLVLAQDKSTGSYTVPRVLLFTDDDTIVETDVGTGDAVVTLRTRELVAVDAIDMGPGEQALIKLDFTLRAAGDSTKSSYCWQPAERGDASRLLAVARALLRERFMSPSRNSQQLRCMGCNFVFEGTAEAACPQCKGEFVVAVSGRVQRSSRSGTLEGAPEDSTVAGPPRVSEGSENGCHIFFDLALPVARFQLVVSSPWRRPRARAAPHASASGPRH